MGEPTIGALSYYDEPLRRLKWILPASILITFVAMVGFLRLLAQPPEVLPPAPPVSVQIIEIPPTPAPAPAPRRVVPMLPEPLPESAPKPKPQRIEPAKPKPAPLPPPQAPAISSQAPPNTGNMGARALYQPMPVIPEELRHHPMDLVAVARFHVAANGSATVELVQPTPEPQLNSALLNALASWRFFPAIENGHPVASIIDIRIPISVH
jgi:periplasmic protein TonB